MHAFAIFTTYFGYFSWDDLFQLYILFLRSIVKMIVTNPKTKSHSFLVNVFEICWCFSHCWQNVIKSFCIINFSRPFPEFSAQANLYCVNVLPNFYITLPASPAQKPDMGKWENFPNLFEPLCIDLSLFLVVIRFRVRNSRISFLQGFENVVVKINRFVNMLKQEKQKKMDSNK